MKTTKRKLWLRLYTLTCLVAMFSLLGIGYNVQAEDELALGSNMQSPGPLLPVMYQWHTFSEMLLSSIVVDNAGNIYAAGIADHTWGSPLHAYSGGYDIGVIKFNRDGVYQWHTFFGAAPDASSDGNDGASAMQIDGDGNLYLTGHSNANWMGRGIRRLFTSMLVPVSICS